MVVQCAFVHVHVSDRSGPAKRNSKHTKFSHCISLRLSFKDMRTVINLRLI